MTDNDSTLKDFSQHLYARCGLAESTIANYVAAIRRLIPKLGERPTHRDIEQLVTEMRQARASYSHVKNTSQALERYMAFLGDPIKLGRPKKPKTILKNPLNEPEVTLLIAATRTLRERAMICLLACSGIRNAELCALRIEDIDIAGQLVRVNHGKGGKDRTASIPGACVETVLRYLRERGGEPGDWLFLTKRRKRQLAPQDLRMNAP